MPIYEFSCPSCRAKFSDLRSFEDREAPATCPKCGASTDARLISRFVRGRSEDARLDDLSDRLEEPDSPTEMRRQVREFGKAMDEDMADAMEEAFETQIEEDSFPSEES